MTLDHAAIRKAYPNVTLIDDTGSIIQDASGNTVAVEQSKIDEARAAIDAEYAATQYKRDRTTFTDNSTIYASIGDQLDMLYHDLVAGKLDATGTWATHIKAVKDANPKP